MRDCSAKQSQCANNIWLDKDLAGFHVKMLHWMATTTRHAAMQAFRYFCMALDINGTVLAVVVVVVVGCQLSRTKLAMGTHKECIYEEASSHTGNAKT